MCSEFDTTHESLGVIVCDTISKLSHLHGERDRETYFFVEWMEHALRALPKLAFSDRNREKNCHRRALRGAGGEDIEQRTNGEECTANFLIW